MLDADRHGIERGGLLRECKVARHIGRVDGTLIHGTSMHQYLDGERWISTQHSLESLELTS